MLPSGSQEHSSGHEETSSIKLKILGSVFSGSAYSNCALIATMVYLILTTNLVTCQNLIDGTVSEFIKGSWRTAEAWNCENPGEVIGEGTASLAIEALGLNGSWREVEACYHQESTGYKTGESAAQLQQEN